MQVVVSFHFSFRFIRNFVLIFDCFAVITPDTVRIVVYLSLVYACFASLALADLGEGFPWSPNSESHYFTRNRPSFIVWHPLFVFFWFVRASLLDSQCKSLYWLVFSLIVWWCSSFSFFVYICAVLVCRNVCVPCVCGTVYHPYHPPTTYDGPVLSVLHLSYVWRIHDDLGMLYVVRPQWWRRCCYLAIRERGNV